MPQALERASARLAEIALQRRRWIRDGHDAASFRFVPPRRAWWMDRVADHRVAATARQIQPAPGDEIPVSARLVLHRPEREQPCSPTLRGGERVVVSGRAYYVETCVWCWSPGFRAGRVQAMLADVSAVLHRILVSETAARAMICHRYRHHAADLSDLLLRMGTLVPAAYASSRARYYELRVVAKSLRRLGLPDRRGRTRCAVCGKSIA